jgi:hypothetical protein
MSHHDDHLHDADLGPVINRLQAERPTASDLELGLIKQRVRGRVAPSARRSRRTEFMRSRLAIIAMLVFGMVLSTGGGALAVSGFTNPSGNAALAEYGSNVGGQDNGGGNNGVLGEEESGGQGGVAGEGENSPTGGQGNNGGVAGVEDNAAQPARQVEAGAQGTGGNQLPFTGFAAIPILLGGVALLASGLVLRRRAAHDA